MVSDISQHGIYLIENFLSHGECQDMIKYIDNKKWEFEKNEFIGDKQWLIDGNVKRGYAINNFFEDEKVRKFIEDKIKKRFPDFLLTYSRRGIFYQYSGIGERMSMAYYKNGKVNQHKDKSYYRDGKRGLLSLLIYLNDNYQGGDTIFYPNNEKITVKPKTGMACIFDMDILHECMLVDGEKYALNLKLSYQCL